ncbi:hypothetical protein G7068_09270 [Leucobacter viscericola]|uniref:DNA-binding transcriptional regulator, MarR family n=1 Tax=Leucobacter viscericola TaxID=2714935 RepID=A0A6G7XG44_9MICO|nr:hypothetical protein [Leucobacter viscericola]QIK63367.1 hypothetical protein G7068_09270 [Leucobacter viscericola]
MTSNTTNNNDRPFGYWLKAVDRLLAAEFATAFKSEGLSRRDWRLLNLLDQPEASKSDLHPHKLRRLAERGWITKAEGEWALTDTGRDAKARLGEIAEGIRARVSEAVTPDEMATTLRSLEKIAASLGWDADAPLPRKHPREGARGQGPWGHRGRGTRGHEAFGHDAFGHGGPSREDFMRRHFAREQYANFPVNGEQFAADHRSENGYGQEAFAQDRPGRPGFDPREMRGMRGRGPSRRGHMARSAYARGFEAGQASQQRSA